MKKITFFGNGNVLLNLIPFIFKSTEYKTVYVGYAPRHAKSICNKDQKVIKVPNTNVFKLVTPFLISRGITRIISEDKLIAL